MAAKQPDRKNVGVFNKGTHRKFVIAECGQPILTEENEDGSKTDLFVFVQGYSSGVKAGRAIFHGTADIFTLGLWEVLGTPIEYIADGTEVKVEVQYDTSDRVDKVTVVTGEEKLAEADSIMENTEPQVNLMQPEVPPEKPVEAAAVYSSPATANPDEPWTGITAGLARVRFVAETVEPTEVYEYKQKHCEGERLWMRLRKGALLDPQKKLGIPLYTYHKNAAKEFYVSTERPLIVMFQGYYWKSVGYRHNKLYICDVPLIHQFEEKDYEISFIWPQYESDCVARLSEILKSDWGVHEKRLLETFDNKINNINAGCTNAFERRRHSMDKLLFLNSPIYK